jgi:hypothetical protein
MTPLGFGREISVQAEPEVVSSVDTTKDLISIAVHHDKGMLVSSERPFIVSNHLH